MAAAAVVAEGDAHRSEQRDRSAFHKALVRALSDPYTISGRATAQKLQALERAGKVGREESFVLDARYELGRRDDAYLAAPVLPLQTSDDDREPLGLRLDPLFENAHRSGLYAALLDELRGKIDPDVQRLASALRLAGWLLTMPEVYAYVAAAVGGSSLPDPVAAFSDVATALDGQMKIDALVREALAAFAPVEDGLSDEEKADAENAKETAKTFYDKLLLRMGVLTEVTDGNVEEDPVGNAIEAGLCYKHGIHQLDESIDAWRKKKVPNDVVVALTDKTAAAKGWLPAQSKEFEQFKRDPTRKHLEEFLEVWNKFVKPPADGRKWYDGAMEKVEKELYNNTDDPKPDAKEYAYTYPKATRTDFGAGGCIRTAVQPRVAKLLPEDLFEEALLSQNVPPGEYARWTPLMLGEDKKTFVPSDHPTAIAVSSAALLEARAHIATDAANSGNDTVNNRLLAARYKLLQLRDLKVCIDAAANKEFSGPGFGLPVLRCRAREVGGNDLEYVRFKVSSDGSASGEYKLDAEPLPPTEDAKAFEDQVGLRDLSGIRMPASEHLVDISTLKSILLDGLDAFQELRGNELEQKKMQRHLLELEAERAKLENPDDDDDDEPSDLVDVSARKRRRDVWSDGLREAALSNDRLYSFARQLGGAIGEPISEVCMIDDSKLAAESKQIRIARRRASQRAAEQHADLVKNVISQVIKDSQLTLGIGEQGNGFAGTSTSGALDLTQLKVVSGSLRREASDLAGLGKGGESSDRFFGNAVKLESLLRSGTGEMTFSDLLAQLRVAGQQLQQATVGDLDVDSAAGASVSIEYLSAPRNCLMLRWRAEALAAIRESFAVFQQEMRSAKSGMALRRIHAFELVEGRDVELTTLFATLCGLKMAANRLHSGSGAMYTSQWAARNNGRQLTVALARVVRRAVSYALNGVGTAADRLDYFD